MKAKRFLRAAKNNAVTERETAHRQLAYRAACEAAVLLKNDGVLPLKGKRIALYGAGVGYTVKGGTGSGEVNERHAVTILEGMQAAGFEVTSKKWLSDYEAEYDAARKAYLSSWRPGKDLVNLMAHPFMPPIGREVTDADIAASNCDTAIYVITRQAGEGADKNLERGEFGLQEVEKRSIERMLAGYAHVILAINSGSYMDIGDLDERVSSVLFFCQLGEEGGTAFADILSGKVNPSGKLTDTWARRYEDVPCGDTYSYLGPDKTKEIYREGIYVGYRYYDTFSVPVRYPFGFGLSYTAFTMKAESLMADGNAITLTCAVTNTGSMAGCEVAELYASAPAGKLEKEYKRLIAFKKTKLLQPGETAEVKLTFDRGALASYSEEAAAFILEAGDYILRLGSSSHDTVPAGIVTAAEEIIAEQLEPICPVKEPFEELRSTGDRKVETLPENLLHITLTAGEKAAKRELMPKQHRAETVAILQKLTDAQKVDVVVGTGFGCGTDTSLNFCPGTVGRTTGALNELGVPNMNLADGPAGLRLLQESAMTKSGKLKYVHGNYPMSAMEVLPKIARMFVESNGKRDEILYQYTTSFPVGTALAQTWNTALCEEIGHAVSVEMSEYGITFWLAPAMNIHRNPLCGRNFEYYSEDPLLTGRIAGAIVRGVQSIPGNYATIKHFCCNNVEDNRTGRNSILSQRALREIYLKGFELCVKEAAPAAVMSSYNLVNGTYTPNSFDLLTTALRREWGFDGLVMTDWFSTQLGAADSDKAIGVGNDLIMPGTKKEKEKISASLKAGTLSMAALDEAVSNILDAAFGANVKAL